MGLEQLDIPKQKNEPLPKSHTLYKTNSNQIIHLNGKCVIKI